jgi:hypothetical protein
LLNTPELLFAAFKSKKINIDDAPVGKKLVPPFNLDFVETFLM